MEQEGKVLDEAGRKILSTVHEGGHQEKQDIPEGERPDNIRTQWNNLLWVVVYGLCVTGVYFADPENPKTVMEMLILLGGACLVKVKSRSGTSAM